MNSAGLCCPGSARCRRPKLGGKDGNLLAAEEHGMQMTDNKSDEDDDNR